MTELLLEEIVNKLYGIGRIENTLALLKQYDDTELFKKNEQLS